jgi:hypothetical protein
MSTTRAFATAAGMMLVLAVYVAPPRAHHSTATVEWTNPHVWIWVIPDILRLYATTGLDCGDGWCCNFCHDRNNRTEG